MRTTRSRLPRFHQAKLPHHFNEVCGLIAEFECFMIGVHHGFPKPILGRGHCMHSHKNVELKNGIILYS